MSDLRSFLPRCVATVMAGLLVSGTDPPGRQCPHRRAPPRRPPRRTSSSGYGAAATAVPNQTGLAGPLTGIASTPDGNGYWATTASGQVVAEGDAANFGSVTIPLRAPIVGIGATPSGHGYWLVASDGGVFSFGDAQFFGSTGAMVLNKPVVGMARPATATATGWWHPTAASSASVTPSSSARPVPWS